MPLPKVNLNEEYSLKVFDYTDDFDEIYNLVLDSFYNGPYGGEPSHDQLKDMVASMLTDLTNHMMVVLYWKDTPVGYLAGSVSIHPFFANNKMAVEIGWYVKKHHRTRYSLKLLDAFEEWAGLIGCEKVSIGHYETEESNRLDKLYQRKKYKPIETMYVKEIK